MKTGQIRFIALLFGVLSVAACLFAQGKPTPLAAAAPGTRDLASLHELLKSNKPITWVFTGDSITEGAEWTHGERDFSELFSEHIRWDMRRGRDVIINSAISGNKTDDILEDFQWRIGHFHPDVVSVMLGMNDAARDSGGRQVFETNLRKLIEQIRAMGAIPILQTTNWTLDDPRRHDLPAYNAIIRDVATSENVILVDNWQYWHTHRTENNLAAWLGNAIHPNGLGHAAIAEQMFSTLDIASNHAD